jgi:hypothetical protein
MSAVLIRLVALSSALVLLHFTAELAFAAEPSPDCGNPSDIHDQWVIGSPEQQGFDPAVLCAMGKGVLDGKLANVDSIVIVRHGVLVYEHYFDYLDPVTFDAAHKHDGHSMNKGVVSLLVGIAIDRGLIKDLDAPLFFIFSGICRSPYAEKGSHHVTQPPDNVVRTALVQQRVDDAPRSRSVSTRAGDDSGERSRHFL